MVFWRTCSHRCGGGGGIVYGILSERGGRMSCGNALLLLSSSLSSSCRVVVSYRTLSTTTTDTTTTTMGVSLEDPYCNIPRNIANRIGMNLHRRVNHPLNTIFLQICNFWRAQQKFVVLDDLSPIVSVQDNFDSLRIPPDHPSRNPSDTYYLDPQKLLRTHTSAHQVDLLKRGMDRFIVAGDVYRRDEIDRSHYPVFHQAEGVKIFSQDELSGKDAMVQVENDLKRGLEGLASHLFGSGLQVRWVDAYFPFTEPSFELEIFFQNEWLEVLGCGVIHPDILANAERPHDIGWAFGLGLERLAMVLFQIPDIRLFWTQDPRFHSQFTSGQIVTFQSYSKYPACYKDLSFWLDSSSSANNNNHHHHFHVNDLNEIVRGVAGDLVEQVTQIDQFIHPKTNRTSLCYRINYRSMDRNLTNEEIDRLQLQIRSLVEEKLKVQLR